MMLTGTVSHMAARILFDSGASRNFLDRNLVEASPALRSLLVTKPMTVKCAGSAGLDLLHSPGYVVLESMRNLSRKCCSFMSLIYQLELRLSLMKCPWFSTESWKGLF